MNELIYIVIGSLIGGVTLFIINKISNKKSVDNAKTSADKILNEARAEADNIKNSKILQAKEKFLDLKEEEFKRFDYSSDKSTRVVNVINEQGKLRNGLNFVNL